MSTKNDFLAKIQDTIDVQQAKLEQLKDAALDETQETIEDIREAISNLEPKLEQAKAKAIEIADAADDKWDDLKDSVESGWDELGDEIEKGWDDLTDSVKNMFS